MKAGAGSEHRTHNIDREKHFIDHLGTGLWRPLPYDCNKIEYRKNLLAGYIKALRRRKVWEFIDQDQVRFYAIKKLEEMEGG